MCFLRAIKITSPYTLYFFLDNVSPDTGVFIGPPSSDHSLLGGTGGGKVFTVKNRQFCTQRRQTSQAPRRMNGASDGANHECMGRIVFPGERFFPRARSLPQPLTVAPSRHASAHRSYSSRPTSLPLHTRVPQGLGHNPSKRQSRS